LPRPDASANVPAPTPTVSVVIPVLNGAATLGRQLEALAGQTYDQPWEIVVADNGSTDGTVELVEAWTRPAAGAPTTPATPARRRPRARCWRSAMPTTWRHPAGWQRSSTASTATTWSAAVWTTWR
jgi:cellulose synthase/poly-beta-1,6-N-acetylglucosamine synthase-like glycosyltransferase